MAASGKKSSVLLASSLSYRHSYDPMTTRAAEYMEGRIDITIGVIHFLDSFFLSLFHTFKHTRQHAPQRYI